jgi:hypothetical protein
VAVAAELLRKLKRHVGHHFWADDYSIANGVVELRRIAGPKQVADLYLLGLAARRKGKFSSLDLNVPAKLVQGGMKLTRLSDVPGRLRSLQNTQLLSSA